MLSDTVPTPAAAVVAEESEFANLTHAQGLPPRHHARSSGLKSQCNISGFCDWFISGELKKRCSGGGGGEERGEDVFVNKITSTEKTEKKETHLERAASDELAVHVLNRRLRLVHLVELDEAEAAAGVGGHVSNDAARLHGAEAVEDDFQGELVDILGQVLDVHVGVLLPLPQPQHLVHQLLRCLVHHVAGVVLHGPARHLIVIIIKMKKIIIAHGGEILCALASVGNNRVKKVASAG